MFGQDGYSVREFRRFNFVYHCRVVKGDWNPSTALEWPQIRLDTRVFPRKSGAKNPILKATYLTAICAVEENVDLFWGFR